MRARSALCAAAAALLWTTALAPDAAAAVRVACGQTITSDTTLANDLADCPGIGIVVGADGITLDLNGHTVDGDGVGDFEGVQNNGHDGVTVRGGAIRDFVEGVAVLFARANTISDLTLARHRHVGVFVSDSSDVVVRRTSNREIASSGIFVTRSRDVRVEDNAVTSSGSGFSARMSDRLSVTGNALSRNTENGLLVFEQVSRAEIARNSVSGNGNAGILVEADKNTVRDNQVWQNGDNIVVAGDDNTVSHNAALNARGFPDDPVGGFGILVDGGSRNLLDSNEVTAAASNGIRLVAFDPAATGPSRGNVVRGNHIARATLDGVLVDDTAPGSLLVADVAERNGDDGIDVESASTTLTRNIARANGDLGIEAVPGVRDGGGNEASGNGNPLQCTNIRCG